jgi:hypothetical protein
MAAGQLKRTIVDGLGASFETGLRHGHPPKWYFGGNLAQSGISEAAPRLPKGPILRMGGEGWADGA